MKKMKFSLLSLLLSLLFFNLSICVINNKGENIPIRPLYQCSEKGYVRNFYDPSIYVIACFECEKDYILSYDLSQCIHYSTLNDSRLQFCKRLSRSGSCEEALCTLQIESDNNGFIVSSTVGHQDENCAIFNSQTKSCTRPRFGFSLDQNSQIIIKDVTHYCAVKDGNKCIEYFSTFVPKTTSAESLYSALLISFSNPEQLDNLNSSIEFGPKCKEGYQVEKFDEDQQYYGCYIQKVDHCSKYILGQSISSPNLCSQCESGYSFNKNGFECSNEIANCSIHETTEQGKKCITCESMYFLVEGQCTLLIHCIVQRANGFCLYCQSPQFGKICEQVNQEISDQCEWLSNSGNCSKCKDNENQYYNLQSKVCTNRLSSRLCQSKNIIADQCTSFICQEGYFYSIKAHNNRFGDQYIDSYGSSQTCELLEQYSTQIYSGYYSDEVILNYIEYMQGKTMDPYLNINNPQIYCVARSIIDNCSSYTNCYNSCLKCNQGYQLQQRDEMQNGLYFNFQCTKETYQQIEHCSQYSPIDFQCLACENYYSVQNGICVPGTVQNCIIYDNQGLCQQCLDYYTVFNNQCFYTEHCQTIGEFNSQIVCQECIQKPDVIIAFVQTLSNNRKECVQAPVDQPCAYFIDDQCVLCPKGYVLIATNQCVPENQVTDNCLKANMNSTCIICASGYRLVNDKCIKVDGSCKIRQTCNSSSCSITCEGLILNEQVSCNYQCPVGYGIANGICRHCYVQFGEGCAVCNGNSKCQSCEPGYIWSPEYNLCRYTCENSVVVNQKSECIKCTSENCLSCSDTLECIQCKNYLSLQEGMCIQQCSEGFKQQYFYGQSICFKCELNCLECQYLGISTTECTKCIEGKYLKQGVCKDYCDFEVINGICTSNCKKFILNNNECVDECPQYSSILIEKKFYDWTYFTLFQQYQSIEKFIDINTSKSCTNDCQFLTYSGEKNQKLCSNQCIEGYYENKTKNQCEECSDKLCSICYESKDKCFLCKSGYSQLNGKCMYICPNFTLAEDPQYCNLCSRNACVSDCNRTGSCTQCSTNFYIYSSECICPENKGYYLSYDWQCRKCQQGCFSCDRYGQCYSCILGYNSISNNQYKQNQCVKDCPERYYLQNSTCYGCIENCIQCNNPKSCSLCEEGYALVISRNNLNEQQSQCLYKCPDGSKASDPSTCACADLNCDKCFENPWKCTTCKSFFSLNPPSEKCEFVNNNSSCTALFCSQCLEGSKSLCQTCLSNYVLSSGKCLFKCPSGQVALKSDQCNSTIPCFVDNCYLCNSDNPNICQICKNPYKLQDSQCITNCQDGYFLTTNQLFCEQCDALCKTCNQKTSCTSCKSVDAFDETCKCPNQLKLFKSNCIQKCPFYSTQIGETFCLEYCADGLYPIHTANKEQRICKSVTSQFDIFCIQNIENIPQIMSFTMTPSTKDDLFYFVNIIMESSPSICYSLKLRGVENSYFDIQISQETTLETIYTAKIPKSSISNSSIIACTDINCTIYLMLYFIEELQYLIPIEINFDISFIITNGANYSGSYSTFQGVCSTCVIPSNLAIPSTTSVKCPSGSTCSSESISVKLNSQISITQKVEDIRFVNNKLQPHSLKITYTDSQQNINTLFITNYYYDSSVLGQITYTFSAIALKSGNLTVSSICIKSSHSARRLLETQTTSENYYYPQIQIGFLVDDKIIQKQASAPTSNTIVIKEQNNSTGIIVASICIGGGLFIVILVIIYRKYFRRTVQKEDLHPLPLDSERNVLQNDGTQQKIANSKQLNVKGHQASEINLIVN